MEELEGHEIIENTEEARNEFGHCYGSERVEVSEEKIKALLNGKCLAFYVNGGEYSMFITLKKKKNGKD